MRSFRVTPIGIGLVGMMVSPACGTFYFLVGRGADGFERRDMCAAVTSAESLSGVPGWLFRSCFASAPAFASALGRRLHPAYLWRDHSRPASFLPCHT